jgi:hypothetical protein
MKLNLFKVIPILGIFTMTSMGINSQSMTEEVDLIQSIYGMEKKSVIDEFLGDSVNDEFWIVYDAYETERKILGKDRIGLIKSYAENYDSIDGAVADDMVKKAEKLNKDLTGLISRYTKKVRKVSGSKVAAQFYQIENYLLSVIRTELFETIPLIGELKTD